MYYQITKSKLILYGVILGLILLATGIKIKDKYFSTEMTKEELLGEKIDNNVLIFSDGALSTSNDLDESVNIKIYLKSNNYTCDLIVKEDGILDNQSGSNLLYHEKTKESLSKYEHIIVQCGLFDYITGNQLGQISDETYTMLGSMNDFITKLKNQELEPNIIIIGPPNCLEFNGISNSIGQYIIDYNLALKMFAKNFDNVHYIDLYEYTKDNPLVLDETEEYTFDEKIMEYIVEQINKIDSEYTNQKEEVNKDNQIIILPEDEK